MSRRLKRTVSLLAVALIAMVQATVSPASCCMLKSVVAGSDTCSVVASPTKTPSCCHRRDAADPVTPVHQPRGPLEPSDCPICAANAKHVAGDRVATPSPLGDSFFSRHVADAGLATLGDNSGGPIAGFGTGEPFRRTALESCAWLCVWRL
jgi:hypothetical protein